MLLVLSLQDQLHRRQYKSLVDGTNVSSIDDS